MKDNIEITDQKIFSDTSERIVKSLQKVYNKNNSNKNISRTSMEIALKQLIK